MGISRHWAAVPYVIKKINQAAGLRGMVEINFSFMAGAHAMIKKASRVSHHKGVMISTIRLTYLYMAGTAVSELEQLWCIAPGTVDIRYQHSDARVAAAGK